VSSLDERRDALQACFSEARECTRCVQLAASRTQVVFGSGSADAQLMFVGEAPGREEDLRGVPFVGRSGQLLDQLLGEIGIAREDVFMTNTLMCRPPDNRDPTPGELERCHSWLLEKVDLVRPKVVCPLGNFATKLLRASPEGITRVHGRTEVRVIGGRAVRLHPLYHPAAALYQGSSVELLRQDMARIPELLALPEPDQPVTPPDAAAVAVAAEAPEPASAPRPAADQLGLF